MSTVVRQIARTAVHVRQRAVTVTVNYMMMSCYWIATGRGLGTAYLDTCREIIETGLNVWLAEQTIKQAHLEIFIEGQREAIERWDFTFSFTDAESTNSTAPPVNDFAHFCATLEALPPGAQYRVVVQTAPHATKVPGWEPSELRPVNGGAIQTFQAFGYGHIDAAATYCGSRQ